MNIKIIYQDKDVIIVEKPAGILVHPVKPKEHSKTLIDYLCKKFPEIKKVGNDPIRPGIVHRLDKDTSGLMIVARNNFSFNYLISKFSGMALSIKSVSIFMGWKVLLIFCFPGSYEGFVLLPGTDYNFLQ